MRTAVGVRHQAKGTAKALLIIQTERKVRISDATRMRILECSDMYIGRGVSEDEMIRRAQEPADEQSGQ